ncbi:hypothetical protein BJ166DRAFT_329246 [Pestalotiopsis sp. NC0098]|nr:hypothetical protein BJ166DRAFT_329246 [Pestalotiopsis sp. NC0098]
MPLDYSKWDALELSDDSDVEVHPNVDKRSFIRAKQNQIHAERQQRKLHIETLKYERQINDGLIKRITGLLNSLKSHASEAETRNPAEVAFQAVMESAPSSEAEDKPPQRPEGVHSEVENPPTYTKMMATLLDQVNKALDEKKPDNRYQAMIEEIGDHLAKVEDLQKQLHVKLAELEKADSGKITSDSYQTGFNSSHVAKSKPEEAGEKKKEEKVELLNPKFDINNPNSLSESESRGDDDEVEASSDAKTFAKIKANDYRESNNFISSHPQILSEKEQDGILMLAFDAQLEGKDDFARNCVHQSLLVQYCRALGKDGVALFFKRITTKGHNAQDVFFKDVQDTYMRIRNRCREINAERAAGGNDEEREQIQLHAVEPGTVINIKVPPKDSQDPEEQKCREIFESFKPDVKKALETGSLDKVNEVLGKMKIAEAEALVGLLSEAGVLSMEEEIIDATTEEGQQHLKEMEKQAALDSSSYAEDPE